MKTNDFKLNVLFVFGRHFGCPYLVILRGRIDLNLKPRLFAFLPKAIVISKGYYACSTILQFLEFSSKTVILCRWKKNYRVFSLTWPASVDKFIGTKESVYIRKEFNFHSIGLGQQHGRRFIVLGYKYGRRDVM